MNEKKLDWHLFWTAIGVVIPIVISIIGCYLSLSKDMSEIKQEIIKIETVMILKQIAPAELFAKNEGE